MTIHKRARLTPVQRQEITDKYFHNRKKFYIGAQYSLAGQCFGLYTGEGANERSKRTTTDVIDGNWHMFTAVYEYGVDISLYLDGIRRTDEYWEKYETWSSVDNTVPLSIGGSAANLNGLIDNVMIFNRALGAQEIQDIYNSQKPATIGMLEPDNILMSNLASILSAIKEILEKLKGLF